MKLSKKEMMGLALATLIQTILGKCLSKMEIRFATRYGWARVASFTKRTTTFKWMVWRFILLLSINLGCYMKLKGEQEQVED